VDVFNDEVKKKYFITGKQVSKIGNTLSKRTNKLKINLPSFFQDQDADLPYMVYSEVRFMNY